MQTIYLYLHFLPWRVEKLCASLVITSLLLWMPLKEKPKISHVQVLCSGSERLRKHGEKCDRGCIAPLPMYVSLHALYGKGSTNNGTELEHGLNSSWLNVHGFASVCYFCCWTLLNLFDLEVTDRLPSWEQNSSAWCDLYKNLSNNGWEKERNLLRYIYVSVSKYQVYKITGLLYQYDMSL